MGAKPRPAGYRVRRFAGRIRNRSPQARHYISIDEPQLRPPDPRARGAGLTAPTSGDVRQRVGRGVIVVITRSILSRLLSLGTYLVVARVLSPERFGLLA